MSSQIKKKTIIQSSVCLDSENMANYLILVETEESTPLATYIVRIPSSYHFYNENYRYYTINDN
jgi:hypothetical protein